MRALPGTGIGLGIAQGPVARMTDPAPIPPAHPSALGADAEKARAREAVAAVARELETRGARAGGTAQDVLEAQALMAEDPSLESDILARLDSGLTAERAVHEAFAAFRETMSALGGYLGERAADLDDVAMRVVARLRGLPAPGLPDPGHPFVLVAKDLAPADTALLDPERVLAVVTSEGGPTSHTAILARERSVVAVVGVAEASALRDGEIVIVDAAGGVVVAEPTDDALTLAADRSASRAGSTPDPATPGTLADGTPVPLLANLGDPAGAVEALRLGAEGVGLFRTEFLFLSSDTAPGIPEQRAAYERLLEAFAGRKVIVRVLDAGADKPLPFLNDAPEENPALGVRGIRALRAHEEVLRAQLTALAEADAATRDREQGADLHVMAPMVATVEEAEYFVALAKEHGIRRAGVMVEVPAAALLADRILAHADFASIGTNDLTQYTLAADRLLGSVARFQDPWHPAVLGLIRTVGAAGASSGRPVGVCGEAAADPLLAVVLVGLGATSLSMAPAALPDVKAVLAQHTHEDAVLMAERALAAADASSARAAALAVARERHPG